MPVVLMGWRPLMQVAKPGQVTYAIMPHKSAQELYRNRLTKAWTSARLDKLGNGFKLSFHTGVKISGGGI